VGHGRILVTELIRCNSPFERGLESVGLRGTVRDEPEIPASHVYLITNEVTVRNPTNTVVFLNGDSIMDEQSTPAASGSPSLHDSADPGPATSHQQDSGFNADF